MMKKTILMLMCALGMLSCGSDDSSDNSANVLVGDWKLVEILADPGDGSGNYTAVDSQKVITFYNDGTITSNGSLCSMSATSNSPSLGSYSLEASTFTSSDCTDPDLAYHFELKDSVLIVNYPCIEPCFAKYKRKK